VGLRCHLRDLPRGPNGGERALARPTLGEGETLNELLQDRTAFEDFDIDRARTQGYGFARLQRLAIEHLLGTR
jgi:xylose isomerase